jgi:hypothetical protein
LTGVTGLVGGSGYSASTTATVIDDNGQGPGTGAVPTLTIVGGVITAIVFSGGNQGSGYTYPAIQFNDPTGSGSGASASPIMNNTATFTASSGIFSNGDVGKVIRMGGGIAMINTYTNSTTVQAVISQPIVDVIPNSGGKVRPQTSGNWTMTTPITTVTGLYHLIGATVTGLADGVVIPPQTVSASGTITLSTPASAITVGLGYKVQLQTLYLDAGAPTVQGQRKKISEVTARIETSKGLLMGANQPDGSVQSPPQNAPRWTGLQAVTDKGRAPYGNLSGNFVAPVAPLYTGDIRIPVTGGYATPGQVCLEQDNPLPMQVLATIPEVLGGDAPQTQASPRKEKGGRQG